MIQNMIYTKIPHGSPSECQNSLSYEKQKYWKDTEL